MQQVARKGLLTAMVAGGALAGAGYAHADAGAGGDAAGSPGVLSGNSVQIPVHVPVNLCGNTVNVIGLLNPASGNACADVSPGSRPVAGHGAGGTRSTTTGGSAAHGTTKGSPGVLSGNGLRLPIDLPVNVTGNSVGVVGIGNPSSGNVSSNRPDTPPVALPSPPRTTAPVPAGHAAPLVQSEAGATLAHTGTDSLGFTVPAGAGLLIGGIVLYRRSRPRT